jgi:hypothetical protein
MVSIFLTYVVLAFIPSFPYAKRPVEDMELSQHIIYILDTAPSAGIGSI